jgi:hypothetical protein
MADQYLSVPKESNIKEAIYLLELIKGHCVPNEFDKSLEKPKPEAYKIGDEVWYCNFFSRKVSGRSPEQAFFKFTIDKVTIEKNGNCSYGGEWNGMLGGSYISPQTEIPHDEVHHNLRCLKWQVLNNMIHKELK